MLTVHCRADDIEFGGSRPAVKNILGGAASFAVIGARLVAGSAHARSVSWIVDVGSDFPPETLAVIQSWGTDCVIRKDHGRLTTRAWNGYHPDEKRDFKYLTPKLRLEPYMLSETQVWSRTFHMVCSSSRCISIVDDILRRRDELRQAGQAPSTEHASTRPIFVWEPVPDLCTPEEQEKFLAANKVVDVVSPNHQELGMMFDQPGWSEESKEGQQLVQRILASGIGPNGDGCLVIRAGKEGSYAFSRTQKLWLPAYHQPETSGATAVVDPTGAGNSFLGALAQGLVTAGREPFNIIESILSASQDWRESLDGWGVRRNLPMALICATIAAGFVVEQIGVPQISVAETGGKELWNQSEFTERVRLYTQRLFRTLDESPQRHLLTN
ncbi:Protein MAK32 [Penicillium subrubescens]|uniref:Protein MAK32 n=1 Tax=Penicillium subrubescens TaxID=1316194 RepID=A0A1Q5SZ83_9EURO|nr:Protein MAK32 [Penicillium subrubescens]